MKFPVCILFAVSSVLAYGQEQGMQPAEALAKLSFMQGDWAGKQDFDTGGGPAMVGDATDRIEPGIAGKYLCEMLSTSLPGRKPKVAMPILPSSVNSTTPARGRLNIWADGR